MPTDSSEDDVSIAPSNDGMTPAEKIDRWQTDESSEIQPEAPVDEHCDPIQVPPKYQEVRSFLLESPAYQWLLKNARTSALLTERKGTIIEEITRKIDALLSSMTSPKSRIAPIFKAHFEMDWDLPGFLRGQEYDTTLEIAVERAITLTGSARDAQALSSLDYMRQTWPSSGREVVQALQQALRSPGLSCQTRLADGTDLQITLQPPKATIQACGGQATLTELCEQLAWLGAALGAAPKDTSQPSRLCLATPVVIPSMDQYYGGNLPSITVSMQFPVYSIPDHTSSTAAEGTCWHAMFRNPVVVNGFPILARQNGQKGLEVSLDMMSSLAEAHYATHYDATLVLKGLCTAFIPTDRTDHSITWHFLYNEDGTWLPYYSSRNRCPGWIGTDKVDLGLLDTGNTRNFVGWTSNITRHLGTKEVDYRKIDWAGASECSAGLAVEQKLTISVSKYVGGSASLVRGNRDKPHFVKQDAYKVQIKNARGISVVLYDVAAQRGWLVDGASALLHLVRTQVVRDPYGSDGSLFNASTFRHPDAGGGRNAASDALKDDSNKKHIIIRDFDSYTDEIIPVPGGNATSAQGGNADPSQVGTVNVSSDGPKEKYTYTSFRELVSQTWNTLEQIHSLQIENATTHTTKQVENPLRSRIAGYEYMEIVLARNILTRRFVNLEKNGAAWSDFSRRINTVTLFGQHFGDIFKPAKDTQLCKFWKTVPWGHEYLAAPISLLKELKDRSWQEGKVAPDSLEIARHVLWSPSKEAFALCTPECTHNFPARVQQLYSPIPSDLLGKIGLGKGESSREGMFAEFNGAVLFGESSALDVQKLDQLSAAESAQASFHDSGHGSSPPTSSLVNSAAGSSSAAPTTSDVAPPSTDSGRASLSPSGPAERRGGNVDQAEADDLTCGAEDPSNINAGTKTESLGAQPGCSDVPSSTSSQDTCTRPAVPKGADNNAVASDQTAPNKPPRPKKKTGLWQTLAQTVSRAKQRAATMFHMSS